MYSKRKFDHHSPEIETFLVMSTKALADEIANWPEAKK